MSITSYQLVQGVSLAVLNANVQTQIGLGFQPFGNPMVEIFNGVSVYQQPMTMGTPQAASASVSLATGTAVNTVGGTTLAAAAIVSADIVRGGVQVAAFTDTTDTASNIIAQLPSATIGQASRARILNVTLFAQTVAAGAGVTLAGKPFIVAPKPIQR